MKKIILYASIILSGLLVISSFNKAQSIDSLEKQNNILTAKYNVLVEQNNVFEEGNISLEEKYDLLEKEYDLLEKEYKSFKVNNELYSKFTVDDLKRSIPVLYKGVTHQEIIDAVSSIQNQYTKELVMKNLLDGDVKSAQLSVGMSVGDNVAEESLADGYIGIDTLSYFITPFKPVVTKPMPVIEQITHPGTSDYLPIVKQKTAPVSNYNYSNTSCCKICSKGKACGDSCISRSYTCHVGPGCACDG